MDRLRAYFLIVVPLLSFLGTAGCGSSSSRQLQSVAINNAGNTAQLQLTATGTFNQSPATVTPLPVDWFIMPPGLAPLPAPPEDYVLSSQPYATACATGFTAIALAPTNPKAPSTGPLSAQVFEDLVVTRTTSEEGGFIVATQSISCP